jgi:hypothetical protein
MFHPFTKCKICNIYVTSASSGFLSVPNCSAAIVIFIGNCCHFLRNIEVPEDATDKERMWPTSQAAINLALVVDRAIVG